MTIVSTKPALPLANGAAPAVQLPADEVPAGAELQKKDWLAVVSLALLGAVCAGFRVFGRDRDYWQYLEYFNLVRSGGCDVNTEHRFEPAFASLVCWTTGVDSQGTLVTDGVLFGLIAFIALMLKFSLFRHLGAGWLLAVGVYVARFYPLHEMTQIRTAIALGFMYWGFYCLYNSQSMKFVGWVAAGAMFHYSAMVTAALAMVPRPMQRRVGALLLLLVLAGLIRFAMADAISWGLGVFVNLQMVDSQGYGQTPNVVSFGLLLDMLLLVLWLSQWKFLDLVQQRMLLLFGMSMVVLWTAADFPVVAWRMSETCGPALCCVVARAKNRTQMVLGFGTAVAMFAAYPYLYATRNYFF